MLLFCSVTQGNAARKRFLLLASYYFYAYWDWRFLSLIIISTVVDFILGRRISRTARPRLRKTYLVCSLVANLSLLGFFKYYNFFVDSLQQVLAPVGFNVSTLNVILPVGISFYTFQTLSYSIDIYRNKLQPCDSFLDFALFVGFFPQLVAGPIVRASEFLPQLKNPRAINWERTFLGFRQFVFGFTKKALVADSLAHCVDTVFAHPGDFSCATTWFSVIAYAFQIYCDFSGYSDMAIGTARMLGYDFRENFRYPYLATNIADFWRRWHISLSAWLRDYLYIPLGGSRCGKMRTHLNLIITMLLGGLWHGAAWTFVFWGFWHGVALAVHRIVASLNLRISHIACSVGGWLMTTLVVMLGWVFFRARNFDSALRVVRQMFFPTSDGVCWIPPVSVLFVCLMIMNQLAARFNLLEELATNPNRLSTPVILFFMLWLTVVLKPDGFEPFLYFQF